MRALLYLIVRKNMGILRNQFRSIGSGLLVIIMVLFYGSMLIITMATAKSQYVEETMKVRLNLALLAGIGILALLVISAFFSRKKALVYDTDAFYLFSGPYSRMQINGYVLFQTAFQSFLFSLLGTFLSVMLSAGSYFSVGLLLFCMLIYWLLMNFFFIVNDYIYVWGLVNQKFRIINFVIPVVILLVAAAAFFLSMDAGEIQVKEGFLKFAYGRKFYWIPFFGWAKWALNGFVQQDIRAVLCGTLPLLFFNGIGSVLFLKFDQDITEQAAADADEVTAYIKSVRERGLQPADSKKLRKVKSRFREGGAAIFSKNMLLMRKTGNFLKKQDVFLIVFYFVFSLLILPEKAFFMYCYMMLVWLLNMIRSSDMMQDLKNYQIYLIPDSPLKKLLGVLVPTLLKTFVVCTAAIVFAGIFTKMPLWQILNWLAIILGYALILISGSVLAVRLLGSRTSVYAESLLQMGMILVSAIPSGIVTGVLILVMGNTPLALVLISGMTWIINLAVSAVILLCCANMMNGKEL